MKKRFKIIITSAMLAMSLALMSFGVYAATTHSLTVNNYIQFDLGGELAVTITGKTAVAAPAGFSTFADGNKIVATADEGEALDNPTWAPWTEQAPAQMSVSNKTVTWIFEISNDSAQYAITASLYAGSEGTTPLASTDLYEIAVKNGTSATEVPATATNTIATIATGAKAYFMVTATRKDAKLNVNDAEAIALPFYITIAKAA